MLVNTCQPWREEGPCSPTRLTGSLLLGGATMQSWAWGAAVVRSKCGTKAGLETEMSRPIPKCEKLGRAHSQATGVPYQKRKVSYVCFQFM